MSYNALGSAQWQLPSCRCGSTFGESCSETTYGRYLSECVTSDDRQSPLESHGGWIWALLAAARGRRGGLTTALIFALLLSFGLGVAPHRVARPGR